MLVTKYYVLRNCKNWDVETDDRVFDTEEEAQEWANYTWRMLTDKERAKYDSFEVYEECEEVDDEDEERDECDNYYTNDAYNMYEYDRYIYEKD